MKERVNLANNLEFSAKISVLVDSKVGAFGPKTSGPTLNL